MRQIVYLNVAKPSALIVLEKAGTLSPSVDQFISNELSLKCYLPSLSIQEDGLLHSHTQNDLFPYQINDRTRIPDIVVGPDSTPTLSFTSGSEGIPKGVWGRHLSLPYYFPWMSDTFGLSEHDR